MFDENFQSNDSVFPYSIYRRGPSFTQIPFTRIHFTRALNIPNSHKMRSEDPKLPGLSRHFILCKMQKKLFQACCFFQLQLSVDKSTIITEN